MRLTEQQKAELLEDANDSRRREEFATMTERKPLAPRDYVQFLCDVVPVFSDRNSAKQSVFSPIEGEDFRL